MTPLQASLHAARQERLQRIAERAVADMPVECLSASERSARAPVRPPRSLEEMTIAEAKEWMDRQIARFKLPPMKETWFSIADRPGEVSVQTIQRVVCDYYHVSMHDMLSARRLQGIVFPRHVAMYLAKTLTTKTLPDLGRRFGGRDHTTVLHGVRRVTALIASDRTIAADVEAITAILERGAADETAANPSDRITPEADAPPR